MVSVILLSLSCQFAINGDSPQVILPSLLRMRAHIHRQRIDTWKRQITLCETFEAKKQKKNDFDISVIIFSIVEKNM